MYFMYKILNENGAREILLYSLISGGYTASRLIAQLKDLKPDDVISLRINSDGGEIFEGIALYNYLKGKNVSVVIDGICASAASIVAMSGTHIKMNSGGMFMIHNPLSVAAGDSEELRSQAEVLDKITGSMAEIYASRTGQSIEKIKELMNAETWMTAQEALALGFIDEIEPAPEKEPEPEPEGTKVTLAAGYEDGIKAERERLRLLDELSAPGREEILNRAKYETFASASDIAITLLKAERPRLSARTDIPESINNLPVINAERQAIDSMAEIINSTRRVK